MAAVTRSGWFSHRFPLLGVCSLGLNGKWRALGRRWGTAMGLVGLVVVCLLGCCGQQLEAIVVEDQFCLG